MTGIATKVKVGSAACAIAVAASLTSVATAEAAPAPVPAAPVAFGSAKMPAAPVFGSPDVPLSWWGSSFASASPDLLCGFRPDGDRDFRPFRRLILILERIFHFGPYGRT